METLSQPTSAQDLDFPLSEEQERPCLPFRVQRILVPIDFSDGSSHVLNYAICVAESFHASIILLHVVEPASRAQAMHPEMLEQSRQRLAHAYRAHLSRGASFESLVRVGRPHSEIADTAKALACDLIVMGTRGARKTSMLGSTAEWVVHHASCPVLTMRPA